MEGLKRAIMNEIELDFSWYCREKRRTRQEMEEWWGKRRKLVDAVLEDAWPAWGTAGALRICNKFAGLGAGTKEAGSVGARAEPASSCPRQSLMPPAPGVNADGKVLPGGSS